MSIEAQAETLCFQTEVSQLLHLVTHALYSNREVFLRELISNASDAADKLRFEALSDSALYENDPELKIWIDVSKEDNTLTIRDNGIGMSREEIITNLGTIAKSGTQEFIKKLTSDQAKDSNLIGQFGVGFYSAYVVAYKVEVFSRRAGMQPEQGVYWSSDGKGEFIVENKYRPQRGTEIVLHIKEDAGEFLDDWRIKNSITKYSDHILLPIVMKKELPLSEEQEKEGEQPTLEEEVVNSATALWTLPKSQISDEEYQSLYKHITHDFEGPMLWSHNRVEGKLEYVSLLYIPTRPPFDLFQREKPHGLKLYVRRVFIMDDAEQLLPMYLRFVRGVVDSSDLPLNVSREILQHNSVIEQIRSGCVKRVLDMLEKLAKEDSDKYHEFWRAFGQVLKEGPAEDFANRDRIAKLLRFSSTETGQAEQRVSLKDYVARMKEGQDKIYYVTAESFNAAKNSPHLEIFRKKNIEVLLLTDRVDEWLMGHMNEFEGKRLQSVAQGDLDLGKLEDNEEKAEEKQAEQNFEGIVKQMKEVLGDKVKEVRVTNRLTDSPVCLVSDENTMSLHLQRLMQAAGQQVPVAPPILEVNPEHGLILRLKNEQDDVQFAEWTEVLFGQALLAEGGHLDDPATFVRHLNVLLSQLA